MSTTLQPTSELAGTEPGAQLNLDFFFADDEGLAEAVTRELQEGGLDLQDAAAALPAAAKDATDEVVQDFYTKLQEFGLLRKVTDIVMAKVGMPWHLREEAIQEVHVYWATLYVKPKFVRNQVANYAYLAGQHAALKLRRTLGAVVTIPGALFRSGRDTAFMEAIGAAVNPKDVDDYRDSMELSVEPVDLIHLARVTETYFEERLGDLNLSPKQRQVAYKALVERMSAVDIAIELAMPLMYVERLLNQVTSKLNNKDAVASAPCNAGANTKGRGTRRNAKPGREDGRRRSAV